MNAKLTDQAVGDLPLSAARAELLEEIMSTPVIEERDTERADRPARRWLVPVAAAAAVATLVAVPTWLLGGDDARTRSPEPAPAGGPSSSATGAFAVLEAPGWAVDYIASDDEEGEMLYVRDGAEVSIHWRPARAHADYVEDRNDIGPSRAQELLGMDATMWAYSRRDHTTIGPVRGEHFLEVRGSGMTREAYVALLGRLRGVDDAGLAAALPDTVVTPANRDRVVDGMLADIAVPPGFAAQEVDLPRYAVRYQVGAPLTEAISCGWMRIYADGRRDGDQTKVLQATDAMLGSKEWDVLHEMQETGEWAPSIWQVGEGMAAGVPGPELMNWLDCDGDGESGHL